jgi:hypothetical protein
LPFVRGDHVPFFSPTSTDFLLVLGLTFGEQLLGGIVSPTVDNLLLMTSLRVALKLSMAEVKPDIFKVNRKLIVSAPSEEDSLVQTGK